MILDGLRREGKDLYGIVGEQEIRLNPFILENQVIYPELMPLESVDDCAARVLGSMRFWPEQDTYYHIGQKSGGDGNAIIMYSAHSIWRRPVLFMDCCYADDYPIYLAKNLGREAVMAQSIESAVGSWNSRDFAAFVFDPTTEYIGEEKYKMMRGFGAELVTEGIPVIVFSELDYKTIADFYKMNAGMHFTSFLHSNSGGAFHTLRQELVKYAP